MKNYLIKGLHRIVDPNWWPGNDRSKEGDLHDYYSKMAVLSEASFLHNLQGEWTLINLVSEAKDIYQMHRQQFIGIWDIWNSEPCNILYCGADTQMLKPTEVFGRYKHFVMWGHTDPQVLEDPPIPHFMNCDIRYYPAEMNREIFEASLNKFKTSVDYWNGDQIEYNNMMWAQGVPPEELVDHHMAYQGPWMPGETEENKAFADLWNSRFHGSDNSHTLETANIVHWHGSRGAADKLLLMESIHKQAGIPDTNDRNIEIKTIDVSHIP